MSEGTSSNGSRRHRLSRRLRPASAAPSAEAGQCRGSGAGVSLSGVGFSVCWVTEGLSVPGRGFLSPRCAHSVPGRRAFLCARAGGHSVPGLGVHSVLGGTGGSLWARVRGFSLSRNGGGQSVPGRGFSVSGRGRFSMAGRGFLSPGGFSLCRVSGGLSVPGRWRFLCVGRTGVCVCRLSGFLCVGTGVSLFGVRSPFREGAPSVPGLEAGGGVSGLCLGGFLCVGAKGISLSGVRSLCARCRDVSLCGLRGRLPLAGRAADAGAAVRGLPLLSPVLSEASLGASMPGRLSPGAGGLAGGFLGFAAAAGPREPPSDWPW